MDKSWKLLNIEKKSEEFLNKFSKPTSAELEPLEKGHKAKLVFSFEGDTPDTLCTEELWVEILLVQNNGKLLGQLEDVPKHIQDLQCGEIIEFEEHHIIDTD